METEDPSTPEEGSGTDKKIESELSSEFHSETGPIGLSCDELGDFLLSKGIPEVCVAPFRGN